MNPEKDKDKEVELILEVVPVESNASKLERARIAALETCLYSEEVPEPKKHTLN